MWIYYDLLGIYGLNYMRQLGDHEDLWKNSDISC